MAAFAAIVPHEARASCVAPPYTFTNGVSAVSASTTNANNQALYNCATTIDNSQIGPAGFYASQIIPTSVAQATFGGTLPLLFPYGLSAPPGTISLTAAYPLMGIVGTDNSTYQDNGAALGFSAAAPALQVNVTETNSAALWGGSFNVNTSATGAFTRGSQNSLVTSASFIVPAVGSNVTVHLTSGFFTPVLNNTYGITDGTTTMFCKVVGAGGTDFPVCKNQLVPQGAVGNTVVTGAVFGGSNPLVGVYASSQVNGSSPANVWGANFAAGLNNSSSNWPTQLIGIEMDNGNNTNDAGPFDTSQARWGDYEFSTGTQPLAAAFVATGGNQSDEWHTGYVVTDAIDYGMEVGTAHFDALHGDTSALMMSHGVLFDTRFYTATSGSNYNSEDADFRTSLYNGTGTTYHDWTIEAQAIPGNTGNGDCLAIGRDNRDALVDGFCNNGGIYLGSNFNGATPETVGGVTVVIGSNRLGGANEVDYYNVTGCSGTTIEHQWRAIVSGTDTVLASLDCSGDLTLPTVTANTVNATTLNVTNAFTVPNTPYIEQGGSYVSGPSSPSSGTMHVAGWTNVTAATGAGTTYTFAKAFATAPFCGLGTRGSGVSTYIVSTSTSAITVAASAGGTALDINCSGHQ